MSFAVVVKKNDLGRIAAGIAPRARAARKRYAENVKRDWAAGVHVRTGALRNSIQVGEDGADTTGVFSGLDYAAYHELGTRRAAANPAARRAAEANKAAYLDEMQGIAGG